MTFFFYIAKCMTDKTVDARVYTMVLIEHGVYSEVFTLSLKEFGRKRKHPSLKLTTSFSLIQKLFSVLQHGV